MALGRCGIGRACRGPSPITGAWAPKAGWAVHCRMSQKITIEQTNNPALTSWIESANIPETDFPIQNLPLAQLRRVDEEQGEVGVLATRIGDSVVDISILIENGLFEDCEYRDELDAAFEFQNWTIAPISQGALLDMRGVLQKFLLAGPGSKGAKTLRGAAVLPVTKAEWFLPASMANYTDFYASVHHAANVGAMFRPDNPLLPNYKHVPIGYHGRSSSLVVSGSDVRRPHGQTKPDDSPVPVFGPCKRMDYELEVGCVIALGNDIGQTVGIDDAPDQILGLCLVNDWSARDIQAWEYQPLGPFLAKNFATSVSPYIVTAAALAPFRIAGPARAPGDPEPLGYLKSSLPDGGNWGFDVTLEVHLQTAEMAAKGIAPHRLSRGSLREMFWTFPQMIAHHASNGCNLVPGDLLACGTVSGPTPDSRGCMLELSWDGPPHNGADGKPKPRKPIVLPSGEKRVFLENGDTVIFTGWCERPGYRRIGFGECRGRVVE